MFALNARPRFARGHFKKGGCKEREGDVYREDI